MEPAIKCCIGNYGAYNAGYLLDEWVELPMAPDELDRKFEGIRRQAERLTGAPCEEFYVSDYDGYPLDGGWKSWSDLFNEHTPIESLNLMAAQLATMDEREIEAAAAYIGNQGSRTSMDEAMNVLLQADKVPYHDYGWGEYEGSDPVYAAIHDSTTAEEKYGYLRIDYNAELKRLLESDSAIDSAFDYEKYGRLCAELDGAILMENGYLANEDIDMAYFNHDEIADKVFENLQLSADDALVAGFERARAAAQAREIFIELSAGHTFYNKSEQQVVSFVKDGAKRKFAVISGVDEATARDALIAGQDLGQHAYDKGLTSMTLEGHDALGEWIDKIGPGGSETGWFWADESVLEALIDHPVIAFPHPSQLEATVENHAGMTVTTYAYNQDKDAAPLNVMFAHSSATDDYSWQATLYDDEGSPKAIKAGVSATFEDAFTSAAKEIAAASSAVPKVQDPLHPGDSSKATNIKALKAGELKPPVPPQSASTGSMAEHLAISAPKAVR